MRCGTARVGVCVCVCVSGVLVAVFSMSNSVVVREGQSVQLNCSHISVKETAFKSITWLRQTNQSAPVSILSIHCHTANHLSPSFYFCICVCVCVYEHGGVCIMLGCVCVCVCICA